jgi:DNA-binding CsgD family transcriptional regulator
MPRLTERQRQCLEGFIARKTAKEVGRELGITHHAVEQHLKAARKKLGATDTLGAARLYVAQGRATTGPYYGPSDVSFGSGEERLPSQPAQGPSLLRDSATEEPRMLQTLSAMQTLMAIGICGVGMIIILSLVVAVADGVAQLTH